jgi:hypothetical protein
MKCKLCADSGEYRNIEGVSRLCFCDAGRSAFESRMFDPAAFNLLTRPEQIAWLIRKRAERYAATHHYKKTLQHLCGLTSAALFIALRREGFTAQIAEGGACGYYHVWVLHRAKIIDLTFTQFDLNAPPVLIVPKDDWRYQQKSLYRKPRRLATTMSEIRWGRDLNYVTDIATK